MFRYIMMQGQLPFGRDGLSGWIFHKIKEKSSPGRYGLDEKKPAAFHSLMLERQKGGTITGIREVISFDEKEILLHTEEGKLSIKGEGLHVKTS